MTSIKNKSLFTIYVIVTMWYIFMSGSIILRPMAGVVWFALALFGVAFDRVPSKKNVTNQCHKYFLVGIFLFLSCIYSFDAFVSLRYLAVLSMFFLIAYFITNTPEKVEIVLKVCTAYCIFLGAVTFIQMLFPNIYTSVFLPFLPFQDVIMFFMRSGSMCGFTNQTSSNAFWMALGLGSCFFLIEKNKITKFLLTLMFIIAILSTSRRGPAIISAFVLFTVGFKGGMQGWFKRVAFFLIALILLVYLNEFIPYINNIIEKFEVLSDSDNLLNGRDVIFGELLDRINERPLFGYGLYSLSDVMKTTTSSTYFSHNAYLQYIFEVGIIGVIPIIIMLVSALVRGVNFIKSNESTKVRLCVFVQMFLILWGMVESSFYDQYRFFLLMVYQLSMLTLIDYHEHFEREKKCPEQIKQ